MKYRLIRISVHTAETFGEKMCASTIHIEIEHTGEKHQKKKCSQMHTFWNVVRQTISEVQGMYFSL